MSDFKQEMLDGLELRACDICKKRWIAQRPLDAFICRFCKAVEEIYLERLESKRACRFVGMEELKKKKEVQHTVRYTFR